MARFSISIGDNEIKIGSGYHYEGLTLDEVEPFIAALQAAKAFAEANADPPKPVKQLPSSDLEESAAE